MSLDSIVQLVFNVYEAHTVALFVKEGERLRCLSGVSFAGSFDKNRPVPMEGTLPGWVVKHREPLIIGNFDKDEETLGYYGKKEEIKSFMAYPLEMPGVIAVDSKKKWVFTDKEKKVLAHFVSVLEGEVEREARLRDMEEEREQMGLTRRVIGFLRESRDATALDEVVKEGLSASEADLALIGLERKDRLQILSAAGTAASELVGRDCPLKGSIASSVLEGGRELLLPYESGYLREKPLLFQDDGARAKQYFGFPLILDEKPFGVLGFASLSQRHLREGAIGVLRDMAGLVALFLVRVKARQEMEGRDNFDPTTGSLRFRPFFHALGELAKKKKGFSLVSVNLPDFQRVRRALGVETADDILRKVYQSIELCMGKEALIARDAGGHFHVALRGALSPVDEGVLKVLRYTILRNISSETTGGKRLLEIGAALFPRDGEDVWELLDTAEDRGKQQTA
jgi:GGDEF domain-containing protein